jgi:hypothetical protein
MKLPIEEILIIGLKGMENESGYLPAELGIELTDYLELQENLGSKASQDLIYLYVNLSRIKIYPVAYET